MMLTSPTPSLRVVNKYKKDITDRVQPQKSSVLLAKPEAAATKGAKIAKLDCIKMHPAIQPAINVQVGLATKLPVQPAAMLSHLAPTAGVAKFKNVHRDFTAKEKQLTKQFVSRACTQL